jgi:hypothetical protein
LSRRKAAWGEDAGGVFNGSLTAWALRLSLRRAFHSPRVRSRVFRWSGSPARRRASVGRWWRSYCKRKTPALGQGQMEVRR